MSEEKGEEGEGEEGKEEKNEEEVENKKEEGGGEGERAYTISAYISRVFNFVNFASLESFAKLIQRIF